eukprot:1842130-Pleurochrysis_carterae.AAC.1
MATSPVGRPPRRALSASFPLAGAPSAPSPSVLAWPPGCAHGRRLRRDPLPTPRPGLGAG